MHAHDLLVGRDNLIPHLQSQIERQVGTLGSDGYGVQFLVASEQFLNRLVRLLPGLSGSGSVHVGRKAFTEPYSLTEPLAFPLHVLSQAPLRHAESTT